MAAQYVAIKRISSLDTPITAEKLDGSLFTTEKQAHEFIISVRKNGVKQTVTGSVSGKFIRANGTTIFLQGSISNGDAVVRLHQDCYNVQGRFTFNIFNTQSGVTTCIYSAVGKMDMGSTETVIDAGDVVPDVSDVVAKQEEMTQVIADARTATTAANTAATNVGSIVAGPYSAPYNAGEYCTQNGIVYKAKQDIPSDEEWTASHWTQTVVGDELTDLKSAIVKLGYTNEVSPVWEANKRIGETGQIIASSDVFAISDFIKVNPDAITSVDGVHSYAPVSMPSVHLYNAEKTHVGFVYANGHTDITSDVLANNASYIRLSQYIITDYPLASVVVYETVRGSIDELEDSVNSIESSVETLSNNVSVQMSQQYANVLTGHTASQNGKYLNNQGQLIDHPNWASLTDYVPVDAEASYGLRFAEQFIEWKNCNFCYYDMSKRCLSSEMHANNQPYTTPADCAYLRISTTNLNYDEKGHNDFSTAYLEKSTDGTTAVVVDNQYYYANTFPRTGLARVKWVLFGDSITEHNNRSGANYDDYIRAETGIITINEGVGGSGYKNRDDNNNAFYQIALKTATEWADADIITVAGGVNDMWGAIDTYGLGSPDDTFTAPADITGRTNNTIMACFNYLLECLIENAPNARIGVISPIPCYTTQGGTLYAEVPYDPECNMEKFVDACKKSCALHGIPYLDLFHNSGLRPWDSDFNAKYFKTISSDSPDGLHPNELGQKWFYPMVREFLKTLK